jgi:hypothetical protein
LNNKIKFNYLYCDAGNYKSWGEIIFVNPDHLTLQAVEERLRMAFEQMNKLPENIIRGLK